jgi:glycosyltransferase involved in cell wall biosynthesis
MQKNFIILPCFNEEEAISSFWADLRNELKKIASAEMQIYTIWVDDGSSDLTWSKIRKLESLEHHFHCGIRFVKNFGHQSAIQAGCEFTYKHPSFDSNSNVIIMDSDGQHPVECISNMIQELKKSHHVQMVRSDSESVSFFKKTTSKVFYQTFRFLTQINMPEGAADFRGLKGSALKNYLKFTESGRFNRGLFYLTEPPTFLPYQVKERKHGVSKYSLSKMLRLAFFGITNFSNRPLIFASFASTAFGFTVCIGYFAFEMYRLFQGRVFEPGWFTIMAWISMWGMILSFCMLLLSIYLGRVFDESKKRPIYLSREEF